MIEKNTGETNQTLTKTVILQHFIKKNNRICSCKVKTNNNNSLTLSFKIEATYKIFGL